MNKSLRAKIFKAKKLTKKLEEYPSLKTVKISGGGEFYALDWHSGEKFEQILLSNKEMLGIFISYLEGEGYE